MENTEALKRIDIESGKFTANGTEYTIETGLTITRYCEFQILEKELGFGLTFKGMFEKIKQVTTLMNKVKFVEAATILADLQRGITKINEREPAVLKICALFMNFPGEDRTAWNNDLLNQKLDDWRKEGLDMRDFFTVALNSVNGFLGVYQQVTQTITEVLDRPTDQSPE
jgi:hypothetical protein